MTFLNIRNCTLRQDIAYFVLIMNISNLDIKYIYDNYILMVLTKRVHYIFYM